MAKVKSAERALRFLELLSIYRDGITFSEVQQKMEIPKSSAFSLIQEFLDNDYLIYDEITKKYYPGLEFVKLCISCIQNTNMIDELSLLTGEVGRKFSCTAHAAILDGKNIMYISKYESNTELSIMSHVGSKIPAHCTALGKMLLSHFTDDEIKDLYEGYTFEKFTQNTISTLPALIDDLKLTRKRGYAIECCEAGNYTACIALPLYQQEKMIAAFSVTMPLHRYETMDLEVLVREMRVYKEQGEQRLFIL